MKKDLLIYSALLLAVILCAPLSGFAADGGSGVPGPNTVVGTVIGVDRPDNCLRIRKEPTSASELMGCAPMGEKLNLTGRWSQDGRWAELVDRGWVFGAQVDTPNKPRAVQAPRPDYRTQGSSYGGGSDRGEEFPVYRESDGASTGDGVSTGIVYGPGADRLYGRMFGPGRVRGGIYYIPPR